MSHLPYVWNISDIIQENHAYRKVLYTWDQLQLVAMALKPWEDTWHDIHEKQDVIIRIEKWDAMVDVDGFEYVLNGNMAIVVPTWSKHITKNISKDQPLYLHMVYALPLHWDHKIHHTKEDAEKERPKPIVKGVVKKVVVPVKPAAPKTVVPPIKK